MRFSLFHLLGLVAFTAVACVALRFAGPSWWAVLSSIGLVLYLAMAVMAFAGNGARRSFGVGFTVCVTLYAALLYFSNRSHELPTKTVLQWIHQAIETRKVVSADETHLYANEDLLLASSGGQQTVFVREPSRKAFLAIGNLLWAILLGWSGALFARWIHRQDHERIPRNRN